ncbi:MAG TPA: PRC-barrel domain-containing protein [Solirubrobacteraceae bacterium]|nr:PRC-barrel domain-containing protein [Solirubrobacteraceae bacterium]
MDVGQPISYQVLEKGTPVYSADGEKIGIVGHVLAVEDEDVFDGIVISEHVFSSGHRFADADEIARIGEHGVLLTLDREASRRLPEPSKNPAVMRDDPAESRADARRDKLRRAWDYVSGNY